MTTNLSYRSKNWPKILSKCGNLVKHTHTKIENWIFSKKVQRIQKNIAPRVRKIDRETFLSVKMLWESDFFTVKNEHTCFFCCFSFFLTHFLLEKMSQKKVKKYIFSTWNYCFDNFQKNYACLDELQTFWLRHYIFLSTFRRKKNATFWVLILFSYFFNGKMHVLTKSHL